MLPKPNASAPNQPVLRLILGPLEARAMEVLWANGECTVREVVTRLDGSIAYTTVMTTLDRLFHKNLVFRRMRDRAYLYSPRVTYHDWKDQVARDVVAKLLAGPDASREVLLACLLEAAGQREALLLREIEKRIRITGKSRNASTSHEKKRLRPGKQRPRRRIAH
jgi:predicted transcriptional regulator